jgi:hypothetical protein
LQYSHVSGLGIELLSLAHKGTILDKNGSPGLGVPCSTVPSQRKTFQKTVIYTELCSVVHMFISPCEYINAAKHFENSKDFRVR